MVSQALSLVILLGLTTSARSQNFPISLQNNKFIAGTWETYVFTTDTVRYTNTANGDNFLMTVAARQNEYFIGRYNTTSGMEMLTCYKYESPADNFYRFIDYSTTPTPIPYGTGTATFAAACNIALTPKPEHRLAAIKQGSKVEGNACPSAIQGLYSYVFVDSSGARYCSGLSAQVNTCGTNVEFDTSECPAAQVYFRKTPASPLRSFACMLEDQGVGGMNYITVADPDTGYPGCIVYKKTSTGLRATYRDSRCLNTQTETVVDKIGVVTTFTSLGGCDSGASAIVPCLVALLAALFCNYL